MQDREISKKFAYPGHQGAVKCISTGGNFIVSGGADDQLHIYEIQVTLCYQTWLSIFSPEGVLQCSARLDDDYVSIGMTEDKIC